MNGIYAGLRGGFGVLPCMIETVGVVVKIAGVVVEIAGVEVIAIAIVESEISEIFGAGLTVVLTGWGF